MLNSALVAMAQGRLSDVERHGGGVIVLAPNSVQGYALVANAPVHQGRPQDGIALYNRALQIEPDNSGLRIDRGTVRLLLGKITGGWDDLAARWQPDAPPGVGDGLPRWSGAAIPAGRLLVVGQPGVGDEILFASLLPEYDRGRYRLPVCVRVPSRFPVAALFAWDGGGGWLCQRTMAHFADEIWPTFHGLAAE